MTNCYFYIRHRLYYENVLGQTVLTIFCLMSVMYLTFSKWQPLYLEIKLYSDSQFEIFNVYNPKELDLQHFEIFFLFSPENRHWGDS